MSKEENTMIDLKANPFFLSDEDIRWAEETKYLHY